MLKKFIEIFGDVICAWCGKKLGTWDGEGTSHGICSDCDKKMGV